jgi:three-Cys-motif partner protein
MTITSTTWDLEPHTKAKHDILKEYLGGWFPIIARYETQLVYIDGFAGPGIYSKGEKGSPVLALDCLMDHAQKDSMVCKGKTISFLFIEKDHDRCETLRNIVKENYPDIPQGVDVQIFESEFENEIEKRMNEMEKIGGCIPPTFCFIDPFGHSGLPINLIGRMMSNEKCEVLINFMISEINRWTEVEDDRQDEFDRLFGLPDWRKKREIKNPDERRAFLIKLYERQLQSLGGARFVRSFEMNDKNDQPIYHLVFGTKHPKGLQVMKKAMYKVDRTGSYRFSDTTHPDQRLIIDYSDEANWIGEASNLIFEKYKGTKVTANQIERFVWEETRYIYQKGIINRLRDSGKIVSDRYGKGKSIPDDAIISFRS